MIISNTTIIIDGITYGVGVLIPTEALPDGGALDRMIGRGQVIRLTPAPTPALQGEEE